jgi:predicted nuclease of restriction endonuclease-like (RecB) superfamily
MPKLQEMESSAPLIAIAGYGEVLIGVTELLESARRTAARATNAVMTATYWEIGRRIVVCEQGGKERAGYGQALLARLSNDLKARFGRGFGVDNLELFRAFYLAYPPEHLAALQEKKSESSIRIFPVSSDVKQNSESLLRNLSRGQISAIFPLPWTHYARLIRRTRSSESRAFYETEALRGGWTVKQLERQIDSQFYERTALSRNKAAMLKKGSIPKLEDVVTPEEEIKDPFVLEFLGLKDEYSERDLEETLIQQLESFLLELGSDFAFIGRQRRLRVGDEWYRVDLLFFHRRLRCLVIIDLKLGKFTHADAGQMHLYLNYAREHWTHPNENPPVGLILSAQKDHSVAHYALEGLPNKVLAAEYRTALPDEKLLADELERTRRMLEGRHR